MVTNEFVDSFKTKFPQHAHLTKDDILAIMRAFNQKVQDTVMQERNGVELPAQVGFMFIGSTKPDISANYNYQESIKHGKPLKYSNIATGGYIGKIFYCNYAEKYQFSLREMWAYTAAKKFKKASSQVYREEFEKFVVIDNRKQVSHLFEKAMKRDYHNSQMEKRLENYNEFDI